MRIKVRFLAPIRPVPAEVVITLPGGSTIRQLVQELERKLGPAVRECLYQKDNTTPYVFFWVNGRRGDLETTLAEGMEVSIVPPIGGG